MQLYKRCRHKSRSTVPHRGLGKLPERRQLTNQKVNLFRRLETMKTAMKKLFSLVLVAALLVCAVPFQAFADGEATKNPITVTVKYDKSGDEVSFSFTSTNDDGNTTLYNIIEHKVKGGGYIVAKSSFMRASLNGQQYTDLEATRNVTVNAGDSVSIRFDEANPNASEPVEPSVPTETTAPTVAPIKIYVKVDTSDNEVWSGEKIPSNGVSSTVEDLLAYCWNKAWDDVYEFDHAWNHTQGKEVSLSGSVNAGETVYIMVNTINNNNNNNSNNNNSGSNTTNKFPYKVYLHIYRDNKVDEPARTIDITNGIALDGKVTLDEVKSVVKNYYTAKTSDGIGYDGMYLARGNWVSNFVTDSQKYSTIEDTNDMRQTAEVHINVMITNANAKSSSSSTADSTNPKTGDNIYMMVTVMGLSAAALAAVYYVSKKRAF